MPQLDEILNKRQSKFSKKSYRSWDLSGNTNDASLSKNSAAPIIPTVVVTEEPTTIIEQPTESKFSTPLIDNKKVTIDNEKITIRSQKDNLAITIREQNDNDIGNEIDNKSYANKITELTGLQEKIFYFLFEYCCSNASLETGALNTNDIALIVNCSYGSCKTSLIRLLNKGLIIRLQGKRARGGAVNFKISKEIKMAALTVLNEKKVRPVINQRAVFNLNQKGNTIGNDIDNTTTYSSSNINTTTIEDEKWIEIDYSDLVSIGFGATQIAQLKSSKANPDIVQESIKHFSYGLEHNSKLKNHPNPLNMLMGVLRKHLAWVENEYMSEKEKMMKVMLDSKKAEKERLSKMIDEIVDLEFDDWRAQLTDEQFSSMVPDEMKKSNLQAPVTVTLKRYFKEEHVLPRLKEKGIV